jgi:UrcA family protein
MVNVTQRSNSPRASALWIALTGFALAAAAQAAPPAEDMRGVKVTYGDLNLASKQGNQVLLARIRWAARQACFAYEVDYRDLQAISNERLCENTAIEQALLKVYERKRLTDGYSSYQRDPRAHRDATTLGR